MNISHPSGYYYTSQPQKTTKIQTISGKRTLNDQIISKQICYSERVVAMQSQVQRNARPITMTESFYPVTDAKLASNDLFINHCKNDGKFDGNTTQKIEFISSQLKSQKTAVGAQTPEPGMQDQYYHPKSEINIKQGIYETVDSKYGIVFKRRRIKDNTSANQSIISILNDEKAKANNFSFRAVEQINNFPLEFQTKVLKLEDIHKTTELTGVTCLNSCESFNETKNIQTAIKSKNIAVIPANSTNQDFKKEKKIQITINPLEQTNDFVKLFDQEKPFDIDTSKLTIPLKIKPLNIKTGVKEDKFAIVDEKVRNLDNRFKSDTQKLQNLENCRLNSHSIQKCETLNDPIYEKIKLIFEDLGTYEGGLKSGKLEGYGVLSDNNGTILYEGEFNSNQFNGMGIMYNECLEQENKSDFEGTLPANWIRYEGLFFKNKREGFGELFFKDGSRYSGKFENDNANGYGTYFTEFGDEICGIWKNNTLKS